MQCCNLHYLALFTLPGQGSNDDDLEGIDYVLWCQQHARHFSMFLSTILLIIGSSAWWSVSWSKFAQRNQKVTLLWLALWQHRASSVGPVGWWLQGIMLPNAWGIIIFHCGDHGYHDSWFPKSISEFKVGWCLHWSRQRCHDMPRGQRWVNAAPVVLAVVAALAGESRLGDRCNLCWHTFHFGGNCCEPLQMSDWFGLSRGLIYELVDTVVVRSTCWMA